MAKILTFGEVIWDIYPDESFIGGAGLNFAAHCRRCGLESALFSAVGNDGLGEDTISIIDGFSVSTKYVKKIDKQTGKCMVSLDEKGMPEYNVLQDVAYDNIPVTDADICLVNENNFDALCFGTLIQRSPVSRNAIKKIVSDCNFKEIVCDINLRKNCYDAESAKFCFENATILKISEEEEPLLRKLGLYDAESDSLEDVAREISLTYRQIKHIIFTLGEKGCFIYTKEKETYYYREAEKVEVVSTVGAGDSFLAAWTAAFLSGKSIEYATECGVRLSGFVVSNIGAIPEYDFGEIIK